MKQLFLAIVFSLVSVNCLGESKDESLSFGAGLGAMYSGLGVNLGYRSQTDFKYVSAGCMRHSSVFGSVCGLGAGWIKTDLLDAQSNRHGLGAYTGIVGSKREFGASDSEPLFGIGLGYHYFLNGIDRPGTNFGFNLVKGFSTNDRTDASGIILQVGYQF